MTRQQFELLEKAIINNGVPLGQMLCLGRGSFENPLGKLFGIKSEDLYIYNGLYFELRGWSGNDEKALYYIKKEYYEELQKEFGSSPKFMPNDTVMWIEDGLRYYSTVKSVRELGCGQFQYSVNDFVGYDFGSFPENRLMLVKRP